ncbi:MAG: PAS domain-containing protein, partial [Myxococcales bacterium]
MLKVFQRPGSGGDASPVVLPELLEALLAGADVGLALFDPELRLLYGNPAFVRFSGTAEPGWSPAAAAGLEGLVAALRGATTTP